MKKITLLIIVLLASLSIQAQSDIYTVLPNNNGTSQNGRAPQGSRPAGRSVWLITAAEMTASDFGSGSVVNALGFYYSIAHNAGITGTIVIYLQNTADATNTKSTTWATAISGMTTVSTSAVTLPATIGAFDIPFSGGSPFTYTGGGLYVAFDYQNFSTPVATIASTAICNNTLAGGLLGAMTAVAGTTPPTTVAASAFRPETRLGKSVTCARPTNIQEVVASKTTTSVTGTWSNVNNTDIEYGLSGFTPGTGAGTFVSGITSPYTITGLTPSTVYDAYFRNNCGTILVPSYSTVTDVETFHTVFEPISPTYTTGFEQEEFPYIGWLATPDNTPNAWFINFGGTGSLLVQSGLSSAVAITPTAVAANERLFSRGINLVSGQLVTITYYLRNFVTTTAPISTNTASYQLTVGNTQTEASQTTILATETALSNDTFVQKSYNFTPTAAGVHYFSFLHNSPANATGTHALIIDSVVITQPLSNDDFMSSKLSVYPNPATNVITISNDANAVINIVEITDLNGRIVSTNELNTTEGQISIVDLATGVYILNITTDQGSATKKIVKQ